MNRIEGPLLKSNPDTDHRENEKKLGQAASSLLKTEVYPEEFGAELRRGNDGITKEHLGHVIVNKESSSKDTTSKERALVDSLSEARIDTMNRAELIRVSETIELDGSNLKKIFETKLIGENGLRRLIKEYINGGDLKKQLRQEILEREIDFERDPILRDMKAPIPEAQETLIEDKDASYKSLIEKAEASVSESSEEAAFYKAKANFDYKQMAKKRRQSRKLDYIMAGFISLLILAIIIMFITRS